MAQESENKCKLSYLYDLSDSIEDKINKIARKCYGADGADLAPVVRKKLAALAPEYAQYPVCIAKTQYSFSDDPTLLNVPQGFRITVRDIDVKSGCGFIVAYLGDIMTMPGLPKVPNAEAIKLVNGETIGLF